MSVYLGSTLLAGTSTETKSNTHHLLEYIPSDHKLNSMEWLRSNTFSWQSGKVYKAAYAHLTADYSGGTSRTETIGSYTITFVEAMDGHRITTDEAAVANIYSETGVAWFYVLDTTNQRFKLPRDNRVSSFLIEERVSGKNGYRLYSNGFCEQWGFTTGTSSATKTVTFSKAYKDTNYNVVFGNSYTGTATATSCVSTSTKATTGFSLIDSSTTTFLTYWRTYGYVDMPVQVDEKNKYLYFYVGEYSQSATEQTAGLNSEMFEDKMDLDGGNATSNAFDNLFSNASTSVKKAIAGILIPDWSTGGDSYSAGSSAPDDGFVWAFDNGKNMFVNGYKVGSYYVNSGSGWSTPVCNACCYVRKGDVITGTSFYFKPLNL